MAVAALTMTPVGTARAQVVTPSGQVQVAPIPGSVAEGAHESDELIRLFDEGETTLTADVAADAVSPGSWSSTMPAPPAGLVPEGTPVHVYLLHFDNVGTEAAATASGSVEFAEEVLGLLFVCNEVDNLCPTLDATDGTLGASAIYPTGDPLRGIELFQSDVVTLSGDRRSVDVALTSRNRTDQVRILVAVPPEEDAGVAPPDAAPPADSGSPPPDSGVPDTGATADTGASTTPPPDPFTFSGSGGCSCRVETRKEGRPTLLALLLLGAVLCARRSGS